MLLLYINMAHVTQENLGEKDKKLAATGIRPFEKPLAWR